MDIGTLSALDSDALAAIIIILITSLGGMMTFAFKAWSCAKQSGIAMEQLRIATEHMARDVTNLVKAHEEFQEKGWTTLPEDIATSSGLTAVIRAIQIKLDTIQNTQNHIIAELERTQDFKHPRY